MTVEGEGTALGAVYRPRAEIVPITLLPPETPFTLQFTVVVVVPVTLAVNCCVELVWMVVAAGETVTLTELELVSCTVAVPDMLAALLVAVIVTVFGKGTAPGAVYNPVALIVPFDAPPFTLQVTVVFAVPVTVAMNC